MGLFYSLLIHYRTVTSTPEPNESHFLEIYCCGAIFLELSPENTTHGLWPELLFCPLLKASFLQGLHKKPLLQAGLGALK